MWRHRVRGESICCRTEGVTTPHSPGTPVDPAQADWHVCLPLLRPFSPCSHTVSHGSCGSIFMLLTHLMSVSHKERIVSWGKWCIWVCPQGLLEESKVMLSLTHTKGCYINVCFHYEMSLNYNKHGRFFIIVWSNATDPISPTLIYFLSKILSG